MSTPTDVLNRFWQDLRDRQRTRLPTFSQIERSRS